MLQNYLKIALRNLVRNKVYSAINIGGLAVGMTTAMLIGLWMYDELSFNKSFSNYGQIAQVMQNNILNGEIRTWSSQPLPLANELRTSYNSDFQRVLMTSGAGNHILTLADKKLVKRGNFVEPIMPEMLTLHMLKGTRSGLQETASILLSVDEEYAKKFIDEERIGNLASAFSMLAIFISCLGIFGLASFMAEARIKEVSVRKLLGASVLNLWSLLSMDFVVLVAIAFGIAAPVAYYFLNNWLQKYEYRTEISWWIFAVSGMAALAITLLMVSFQSIKAALMNPVKALRSE